MISFIRKYLALSWASATQDATERVVHFPLGPFWISLVCNRKMKNAKVASDLLSQTSKLPGSNRAGAISPKSWGRALDTVTPSGCTGVKSTTFSFHPHFHFWHYFKAISHSWCLLEAAGRACLMCLVLWPGAAWWQRREEGEPCIRGKEAEERCWENPWKEEKVSTRSGAEKVNAEPMYKDEDKQEQQVVGTRWEEVISGEKM